MLRTPLKLALLPGLPADSALGPLHAAAAAAY